jgi:hypothetical protein
VHVPTDDEDPHHDPAAAFALIKQAHQSGGRALSLQETLEFVMQPFNMGRPKAPEKLPGVPGPKFRRTQYEQAFRRRLDLLAPLHRKLVWLPKLAQSGKASSWLAQPDYLAVLRAVLDDDKVPAYKKVDVVLKRFEKPGRRQPDERSVRRHLATLKSQPRN